MVLGIALTSKSIKVLAIIIAILAIFDCSNMIWSVIHNHEYIAKNKYTHDKTSIPSNYDNEYQYRSLTLLNSIDTHLKVIEYTLSKGQRNHEN